MTHSTQSPGSAAVVSCLRPFVASSVWAGHLDAQVRYGETGRAAIPQRQRYVEVSRRMGRSAGRIAVCTLKIYAVEASKNQRHRRDGPCLVQAAPLP